MKWITSLFVFTVSLVFINIATSTPYTIEKDIYVHTTCRTPQGREYRECGHYTDNWQETQTVKSHNHTGSHPSTVKRTVTRYRIETVDSSCSNCGNSNPF